MTSPLAVIHLIAATAPAKTSAGSTVFLFVLIGIAVVGYFFWFRPQQAKAKAARAAQGSGIEVGDEVQTIGGVIGTVLEIHGDRYTLLTGALGEDGNLAGAQPTRIVFVRQAIARKIEPVADLSDVDDHDHDHAEVDDDEETTASAEHHPAPAEHAGDEEAEEA
jgi:preprotein translocase subunit YajC